MHNLPIVDEAIVRALQLEAAKPGNDDKHTQIFSLASSRAENVEQFDPEMLRAFFEMSKWCMYERNFRRAAMLMEKAWASILSIFPDSRVKQLEALFVLKESYVRLDEPNAAADALKAALAVMQDCIDRRDAYALTNLPQPPQKFAHTVLEFLRAAKHPQALELKRKVAQLDQNWNLVRSAVEPAFD